jgi:ureidoacrylate peracid hydrolase
MFEVLTAARTVRIRVFYALHHRYRPGDYETWKYIAAVQKAAWLAKTDMYYSTTPPRQWCFDTLRQIR